MTASRILKSERLEDLSVRRLAREVGVTPANFYNHFASLDELLQMVAADGFDKLTASSARVIAQEKDRRAALLKISVDFVEFAMANRQLFRAMFEQFPDSAALERLRAATDKSFGQLTRFVYGRDLYDPAHIGLTHERSPSAYAMFALAYGLARSIVDGQFRFETGNRGEIKHFVEEVVGILLDGTLAKELG